MNSTDFSLEEISANFTYTKQQNLADLDKNEETTPNILWNILQNSYTPLVLNYRAPNNIGELMFNKLTIQSSNMFGVKTEEFSDYNVYQFQQWTKFRDNSKFSFAIYIVFNDHIQYTKERAQFALNMALFGSWLSVLFTFWGLTKYCLWKRYLNEQGITVNRYDNYQEQLDENPIGNLPKVERRPKDYFNYHYFTLYCCLTKKNSDARKRLANKISYISLYDYMHMLDNHHKVIKGL